MTDTPEAPGAHSLQTGSLGWFKVAALGMAIAISGNFAGWNYGLGVGGWGGMLVSALAMGVLFFGLTQCLGELAAALPEGAGFDFYARRSLGPAAGYLAGMSVAIALAVGTGLAASFAEAYTAPLIGIGGWTIKIALIVLLIGLQLRGVHEAVGVTMAVGLIALVILVLFCAYVAPQFSVSHLYSASAGAPPSLFPHGFGGTARCIPFALFLFLGVEQAAHAAAEMRDLTKSMPKALIAAIIVAFSIGMCVLFLATGAAGADALAPANNPLYAAIMTAPGHRGSELMAHLAAAGAVIALLGTFFSLAYAASRQIYQLAGSGYLPRWVHRTNQRHAPASALLVVAAIGLVAAAFPPDAVMVIFIFLISVSHLLVLLSFLRLRTSEPGLPRPYRALGGRLIAAVATVLSASVMISCYELQVPALTVAAIALVGLYLYFLVYKPGSTDSSLRH